MLEVQVRASLANLRPQLVNVTDPVGKVTQFPAPPGIIMAAQNGVKPVLFWQLLFLSSYAQGRLLRLLGKLV